jgi:hypothetical protein
MKSIRNKAGVAQRQRMDQRQLSTDFLDRALEWRRIFAETWGTFLLVVVAAGGGVVAARCGGAVTPGMMVVAPRCRRVAPYPHVPQSITLTVGSLSEPKPRKTYRQISYSTYVQMVIEN